jgi:hypothetical protein
LDTYKLFKCDLVFKGKPLREFVESELETVQKCHLIMAHAKKANPELARKEDERKVHREKTIRRK